MEKFEIQCDTKTVWREANLILFSAMQMIDSDLVYDYDKYIEIRKWNKNRVMPLKAVSKVNFYNKQINGLVIYITYGTRWWKTIPKFRDKATLVIYMKKLDYVLAKAREHFNRLRSDDEKGNI